MSIADEVWTLVHAFDDTGRKEAVRALASKVAQLETAVVFHKRNAEGNWRDAKKAEAPIPSAARDVPCVQCGQPRFGPHRPECLERLEFERDVAQRQRDEARAIIGAIVVAGTLRVNECLLTKLDDPAIDAVRAILADRDRLHSMHEDETTWRKGVEVQCDAMRKALEYAEAAIGDRLLANGPLAPEYAHGVLRAIRAALAPAPALPSLDLAATVAAGRLAAAMRDEREALDRLGDLDELLAERDGLKLQVAALTRENERLRATRPTALCGRCAGFGLEPNSTDVLCVTCGGTGAQS